MWFDSPLKGRYRGGMWKPRFSLRALLILTLLVGVGISWFTSEIRMAIRQQPAVEHVRGLSGHATYRYQVGSPEAWHSPPPLPPVLLRRFTGDVVMSDVVIVSLHSMFAVDQDLEMLSSLPKTEDLRINIPNLTDQGLQPIAGLNRLQRLDIRCRQIGDTGLLYLAGLSQLERLDLSMTQVTDDGLQHLRGLKSLQELKLRGTHVTTLGVEALQNSLPNCKILGVGAR